MCMCVRMYLRHCTRFWICYQMQSFVRMWLWLFSMVISENGDIRGGVNSQYVCVISRGLEELPSLGLHWAVLMEIGLERFIITEEFNGGARWYRAPTIQI